MDASQPPPEPATDSQHEFVRLLTDAQPRLFAYIAMLLGGLQEADDVLQETNVTLCEKAAQFRPGSSFIGWAREIAYFKTLSYLRDRGRRRVLINQELINLSVKALDRKADERQMALRHCLSDLDEEQRGLLRMRYTSGVPLAEIGQRLGKSEGAIKMALRRVRIALLTCINRRLEAEYA